MTIAEAVRQICNKYTLLGAKVHTVGIDHIILNDSQLLKVTVEGNTYFSETVTYLKEVLPLTDTLLRVMDDSATYGLYDIEKGWQIPCYYAELNYEGYGICTVKQVHNQAVYDIIDIKDSKVAEVRLWQRCSLGSYLVGISFMTREFMIMNLKDGYKYKVIPATSVLMTQKMCIVHLLNEETGIADYSIITPDLDVLHIGKECNVHVWHLMTGVITTVTARIKGKQKELLHNEPVLGACYTQTGVFYKYSQ